MQNPPLCSSYHAVHLFANFFKSKKRSCVGAGGEAAADHLPAGRLHLPQGRYRSRDVHRPVRLRTGHPDRIKYIEENPGADPESIAWAHQNLTV
jgi:hypothetical protein